MDERQDAFFNSSLITHHSSFQRARGERRTMPDVSIRIRRGSDGTKTQQIFNQIASAILAGKLERGDALTSERALAEHLGVSRNIVRNAYRRLEEHGYVETVSTAGRPGRPPERRGA